MISSLESCSQTFFSWSGVSTNVNGVSSMGGGSYKKNQ